MKFFTRCLVPVTVSNGCCKYEEGPWEEGGVICPREEAGHFTEEVIFFIIIIF